MMSKSEVFDPTAALERLEGDQVLLDELTVLFLQHVPEIMMTIQDAAQRQDFTALELAAHSLKGAAANLCASRVTSAAHELEELGRQGAADRLTHGLQALHQELTSLKATMAAFIKERRACAS